MIWRDFAGRLVYFARFDHGIAKKVRFSRFGIELAMSMCFDVNSHRNNFWVSFLLVLK